MLKNDCDTARDNGVLQKIPMNPADIVKRLEELNKWQEEQKKLLSQRQNMQRQMLGMEQKNMYQMLGLQSYDEVPSEIEQNMHEQSGPGGDGGIDVYKRDEEYEEYNESQPTSRSAVEPSSYKTLTSGYGTEDVLEVPTQKSKKPFLKRGEGLKQRFKIDPEELRLNNLPRYKYANAHPKLRLKTRKVPQQATKSKEATVIPRSSSPPLAASATLDAHEKRFQQLLMSSKNVCNSTPDTKSFLSNKNLSGLSSNASSSSSSLPKVRFVETKLTNVKHVHEHPPSEGPSSPISVQVSCSTMAWSKILDSQQIKPLPIIRNSSISPNLPQSEEDIFELLEEKANNGSFDMDSTCIKQFMMQRRTTDKFDDTDVIPINDHLKTKRLQPLVSAVSHNDSNTSLEEDGEDSSIVPNTTEADDEYTTQKTIETTNSPCAPARTSENRVRFSESHDTREFYQEDTITDSSNLTMTGVGEGDSTNNELFEQFKQALFAALQDKANQHSNEISNTTNDTTITPKDSFISQQEDSQSTDGHSSVLQEQTKLIKLRLMELEKEIATFKDNNLQLMKAKQEHELEKSLHAQEQLEAMERLKDERIQMEIYLHDERMKLEEEKRKCEQQIKMKSQASVSKDRKEIEKLKEQIVQLEAQLKTKDCNHAAAQARWRTQIKTMEREEKRLHEQIEILTKENKRLENEMLKATRENNNKLLQEINRNIAKLAPKNSHHASEFPDADQPPVLASAKSLPKTIVATTNKTSKSPTKKRSKKSLKTNNNRLLKQSHTLPETPSSDESESAPETNFHVNNNNSRRQQNPSKENISFEDDEDILKELRGDPNENKIRKSMTLREMETISKHSVETKSPSENKATAPETTSPNNMKREIVNADGSKDIWYPNGNLKKISADGMLIRMLYYNKDIKETNINEGTVKYYYAETNTWHTTYLDGLEILEFPNGQIEHRHKNGLVEVHYPNNSIKIIDPRDEKKSEEWRFPDGTHLVQMRNGDKILSLPNGQKEIHTKLQKRREYPDGTVKIVYPDGSTETRYSNGRVRLKDKDGNLVMDTEDTK